MKKVALMTWFQHDNFGTALQAVATTRVVKDMGYMIHGIDYFSKGYDRLTKLDKIMNPMLVKEKIKLVADNRKYKHITDDTERKKAFERFRNSYLKMTRKLKTSSELNLINREYDAFICGSDQIWSPREFNPKYYLDFVAVREKKIAYSPSFGRGVIDNDFTKKRVSECVSDFKHLSIREKQGSNLIKKISGIESEVFVDPTLLLTRDQWNDYKEDFSTPKSYILCYFLGDNPKHWGHIENMSQKIGLKVMVIPINPKDYERGYSAPRGIGPGEFLTLVNNATLICTDSFHGTIFSIIYEKPFITYKRFIDNNAESQNSRIYNLLELLKLEDRLFKYSEFEIARILNCNIGNAQKIIANEKKRAIEYITNSLEDAFSHEYNKYKYDITPTCSGCSVCLNVCPVDAIEVKINNNGFYEAKIDYDKCINCGLCREVCAFNGDNGTSFSKDESELFMLHSKSPETLSKSTSGGAAHEISKLMNNTGYDVVGCVYDKKTNSAKHKVVYAGETESLNQFQGSKYIQSNTIDAFKEVLQLEKAVIIGTPCQVAGINNLLTLKKNRNKFLLIDLICHGVPTIHLWNKYLDEGRKKFGFGNHPEVHFRYKSKGWKKKYISIYGNKKHYVRKNTSDLFYRFFELQSCYMTSCYECNFRISSKADIRIGDYWGNKYDKYKDSGASMIIAQTKTGKNTLDLLVKDNRIELVKEDLEDYWNVQCPENPIKPLCYEDFIYDLKNSDESLEHLMNKYFLTADLNKKLANQYRKIKIFFKIK